MPSPAATTTTRERELKLDIPESSWDSVLQALHAAPCKETALHAVYLDTPQRDLARAGAALRLRREGKRWVQTLKASGEGLLTRLEDNVEIPRAPRAAIPAPDLARHASPEARALLHRALGVPEGQMLPAPGPVFEVQVRRLNREVKEGGSRIELALDEGEIRCGERRRPVREIEFELLEGQLSDLLRLARKWRERHGLWISLASKAARGHWLSSQQPLGPAVTAFEPAYARSATQGEMAAAVLLACLGQVIGNAAAVAEGGADDDHVHQLRVGLRRLRTALRELPLLEADQDCFQAALEGSFRQLGQQRDRRHVLALLRPKVEKAIGLAVPWPAPEAGETLARDAARDPAFQDALLALLARAQELPSSAEGRQGHVRRAVRPRLQGLLEQVLDDGKRFRKLDEAHQHRVRKRLKRLRYLAEAAAPLFPPGKVRRFIDALKPVQDALGACNDTLVALQACADPEGGDEALSRAAQWLDDRRRKQAAKAQARLRALREVAPFWIR